MLLLVAVVRVTRWWCGGYKLLVVEVVIVDDVTVLQGASEGFPLFSFVLYSIDFIFFLKKKPQAKLTINL
eukprot:m.219543 g.219543  ORF g.219543 m.219543 type:complete len:70 (-) comp33296_c0_seq1:123-332(-)